MSHRRLSAVGLTLLLPLLTLQAQTPPGKPAPPRPGPSKEVPLVDRVRSPLEIGRPVADKLRSPRETLRTLYFAITVYDVFPEMMEDAIAALDLDGMVPKPAPDDAALMALTLDEVLQAVALPLTNVPDLGSGENCILYDSGGITLEMRRGPDGGWRFTGGVLARLESMRRAARELRKQRPTDLSAFRDGLTDPRATMRQFMVDCYYGDFYTASRALDLSSLSDEERREKGPGLAQQLANVIQRRSYVFRQEIPYLPDGPAYTWRAGAQGRIAMDRVRQTDGKEAWVFTRQTVRNIPKMYQASVDQLPDGRFLRMNLVVPQLEASRGPAVRKRPDDVPPHLGSPRAVLRGFFRTMEAAEKNDTRLTDSLDYLDLKNIPPTDRAAQGTRLATKLEMVLRKLAIDLATVADDWNAPTLILGESQSVRVEVSRQRDGCWRFSEATITRIPEMFDKLAGKGRGEQDAGTQMDNPRESFMTFQTACSKRNFAVAARCLNLTDISTSARDDLGPVLAFKLKYVLDRLGRVFLQEVPEKSDGPRYTLYRGNMGRIALDRRVEDPGKGQWQFTAETVGRIEPMFRAVLGQAPDESHHGADDVLDGPRFREQPGVWVRLRIPPMLQMRSGKLDLYQWFGLIFAGFASWLSARIVMIVVTHSVAWILWKSGSALSHSFVSSMLRPLTWLGAASLFFLLLMGLDLPVSVAAKVFALQKFLLAGLFGWLCIRIIDLSMSVYANSELLRPHRCLSDMIVPVGMRLAKGAVFLIVLTYIIYGIGEVDLLGRFLTGLGMAGLAASLAAQDAMKSFFGTLLLIGERAFRIGDRIIVDNKEGVVEQVGFRSTRLRTAEDSLLTIPNSVIAAAAIDNMGARSLRRLGGTLVVSPDTDLERVLELRTRLLTWAEAQPLVVRDRIDFHLHRLTPGGVELSLTLFLTGCPANEELRIRDELNCEILRLAESLGVQLGSSKPTLVLQTGARAA